MNKHESARWSELILPNYPLFRINFREIWSYRDLLVMFVMRDFSSLYRQTVLGPVWFIIQPLLTTFIFSIVFGSFAGISTDGQPKMLFYLSGITIWNYFSDCFNRTSNVLRANASIFGKVYFPRIILPMSIIISGLIRFLIQFILFLAVLFYYRINSDFDIGINIYVLITPFLLLLMGGISLGAGIVISAMTTKYRDFSYLVGFGVTLLMYATPVIYPASSLSAEYKNLLFLNPLTGIVEAFRFAWLGSGYISIKLLAYSTLFMLILLSSGLLIFNKVEKNFMDTV